jgi:hypothetical protein
VLYGEDSALDIACGLRVNELGVPMFPPHARSPSGPNRGAVSE